MNATQRIIDHYEMDCPDDEANTIESIMRMNDGSDKDIIIENLRGWFDAKAYGLDKLVADIYKNMLTDVDWDEVYSELHQDVFGRKAKA